MCFLDPCISFLDADEHGWIMVSLAQRGSCVGLAMHLPGRPVQLVWSSRGYNEPAAGRAVQLRTEQPSDQDTRRAIVQQQLSKGTQAPSSTASQHFQHPYSSLLVGSATIQVSNWPPRPVSSPAPGSAGRSIATPASRGVQGSTQSNDGGICTTSSALYRAILPFIVVPKVAI